MLRAHARATVRQRRPKCKAGEGRQCSLSARSPGHAQQRVLRRLPDTPSSCSSSPQGTPVLASSPQQLSPGSHCQGHSCTPTLSPEPQASASLAPNSQPHLPALHRHHAPHQTLYPHNPRPPSPACSPLAKGTAHSQPSQHALSGPCLPYPLVGCKCPLLSVPRPQTCHRTLAWATPAA